MALLSEHTYTATLDGTTDLDRVGGELAFDEGWAPHVQATITIPIPADPAVLDDLDPRTDHRVQLSAAVDYGNWNENAPDPSTLSADLGLRRSHVDLRSSTVQLTLASDEALLMDDLLLATTPDYSYAKGPTLRAVVAGVLARIGATLEPGGADDVDLTPDAVNAITNPSAIVDLTGAAAVNLTLTRQASGLVGQHGTGYRMTAGANSDSYITLPLAIPLVAGGTYTARGRFHVGGVALAGTAHARARRIVVISNPGGVTQVSHQSAQATNTAETGTDLSLTFTLAADVTTAEVRFYLGHTSNIAFWFDCRLSPGTTDTGYFDGDTSNPLYSYAWLGPAGLSQSIRVDAPREASALIWEPGVSAWRFLQSLFQAFGLRLFCDELRKWRLVDGGAYVAAGALQLAVPDNLIEAGSDMSRDRDEWFDAALVRYRWLDAAGRTQERIDWYADPGHVKAREVELTRPYPGPGFAEYLVRRARGMGRTLELAATSRYTVRATQPVTVTLPGTPVQTGVVGRVTYSLDDDRMRITTRGLTDTPPESWLLVNPALTWAAAPATRTFAAWINPNGV